MTLSSGALLAEPCSFIHVCCRISFAVARFFGSCKLSTPCQTLLDASHCMRDGDPQRRWCCRLHPCLFPIPAVGPFGGSMLASGQPVNSSSALDWMSMHLTQFSASSKSREQS